MPLGVARRLAHEKSEQRHHDRGSEADDWERPTPAKMSGDARDDEGTKTGADQRVAAGKDCLIEAAALRRRFLADDGFPDRPTDAVADAEEIAHDEHRPEPDRHTHR